MTEISQEKPTLLRRIADEDHEWAIYQAGGEPLIQDIELAAQLGFERPRDIRRLIKRYAAELGEMRAVCREMRAGVGRPATVHYLTEFQALFLCGRSETPQAGRILKAMVRVFVLARRGELVVAQQTARAEVEAARTETKLDQVLGALAEVTKTLGQVVTVLAQQRALPPAAPALPAARPERVNTATLCSLLGMSSGHLFARLRQHKRPAIDATREWVGREGYLWNVEAVRALLNGPTSKRTWEPAHSGLPSKAQIDDQGLRKAVVTYVQDYCKRAGKESSEDRRQIWRDLYSSYALRTGSDPMAEARKGEKSLDVIERHRDLATFLSVCMERLPASKEYHA